MIKFRQKLISFDSCLLTGLVLIDLQRTLDTINHEILSNVFRWLFSQLLALNVSIKNQFSNVPNINYGVLQASIFEPLMFPLYVNLVSTNVPLLYPLKTSENLQFSDVVRGYRSETLVKNGFMISSRLRIAPD